MSEPLFTDVDEEFRRLQAACEAEGGEWYLDDPELGVTGGVGCRYPTTVQKPSPVPMLASFGIVGLALLGAAATMRRDDRRS